MKEMEIYKSKDGKAEVEVHFDKDTVWLNRHQLSVLFARDIKTLGKHISNVFKEMELERKSVVANFATTARDGKTYQVEYYNLDMIISVGYRVKSMRGTQFRQWATQRLKDYLVQGYAINQKRLDQLQKVIEVIPQSGKTESVQLAEAKGLLDILSSYTQSFILLNQYNSHDLHTEKLNEHITYEIEYREAHEAINELKKQLIAKKSKPLNCSVMRKIVVLRVPFAPSCKLLTVNSFTRA